MKLRQPGVIRLASWLGSGLIRAWMDTVRIQLGPECPPYDPRRPSLGERFIYAFWHESLLAALAVKPHRPIKALISHHADGEIIAQVCQHLEVGTVRGSTTRGGSSALRGMIENAADCHLLITPDGPKGPRRHVQQGVIYIAAQSGLRIVPVGVGFGGAWRARSWDRFAIPHLLTQINFRVTDPLSVPPTIDRERLEQYRSELERRMLAATQTAEESVLGRMPSVSA